MILSNDLVVLNKLIDEKQFKAAHDKLQLLLRMSPIQPALLLLAARYFYAQRELDKALDYAQQALLLGVDPMAECHVLLGKIYGRQKLFTQSLLHFQKAIEQGNDEAMTYFSYGRMLLDLGEMKLAHKYLFKAWQKDDSLPELATNLLFATMLTPGLTDTQRAAFFHDYARRFIEPDLISNWTHTNHRDPNKKLRVGYVSSDLRYHAAVNPIYPLLRFFNKDAFEVVAYSQLDPQKHDPVTETLSASVDKWVGIAHLSDKQVAKCIRQDKIDILVDCNGYTQGHRLGIFALKPAPIQVSAFGFIFTTGMQSIDYQFSDVIATPPEREVLYTERLIHLSSQIHWRPLLPEIEALSVREEPPFKANGYITFGSGNATCKHNEQVIALWAAIMRSVPNSKIYFKHVLFGEAHIQAHFRAKFAKYGVTEDRLLFAGQTSPIDHMRFYNEIDIALDPFPYTGGMTTCETLYMGVPVIALDGDGIRTSQSLLTVTGISELIAANLEEYGRKAIALASQRDTLLHYHQQLRSQLLSSPIANTGAFVWEVEQAYRHIWQLWCQQEHE